MFGKLKYLVVASARVVWDAIQAFSHDRATHMAAAMAFYTLFAVAPMILIATAIGGLVYGAEAARAEVVSQVELYVGPEAVAYIERLLENWRDPSTGILATIIGAVTSIYLAFRVFDALRDTLDTVWGVRVRADVNWTQTLWQYTRSFLTMLLVGPMVLISTLLTEVLTRIGPLIRRTTGYNLELGPVISFTIAVVLLTGMFAIIYKWLPDVEIMWRDVLFGAVITALLFSVGRSLIAFYMATATTASLFGAAGSLVVLLFWLYYSAQILYFGAELTEIYARRHGQGIEPDHTAVYFGTTAREETK
jgi:membrane protein